MSMNTNFLILCYDFIKESRRLCDAELVERDILKAHMKKTLDFQRIYWKQRATVRQIKVGEANTKFFQAKATIKYRNNWITMFKNEQGQEHFEHNAKAALLYRAFKERMGTIATSQNPLLLHHILHPIDGVSELEAPFSKEE